MLKSHYGQLWHIFTLKLPHDITNEHNLPHKLLLAFVLEAPTTIEDAYEHKAIWYAGELSSSEVIAAVMIQCGVGCVYNTLSNCWWIIDWSLALVYPEFI